MLTGCRREEIGSLLWSEIDLETRTITLPKERTKNGQEHIVPLCDAAVEILKAIPHRAGRDYVFGIGAGRLCRMVKAPRLRSTKQRSLRRRGLCMTCAARFALV